MTAVDWQGIACKPNRLPYLHPQSTARALSLTAALFAGCDSDRSQGFAHAQGGARRWKGKEQWRARCVQASQARGAGPSAARPAHPWRRSGTKHKAGGRWQGRWVLGRGRLEWVGREEQEGEEEPQQRTMHCCAAGGAELAREQGTEGIAALTHPAGEARRTKGAGRRMQWRQGEGGGECGTASYSAHCCWACCFWRPPPPWPRLPPAPALRPRPRPRPVFPCCWRGPTSWGGRKWGACEALQVGRAMQHAPLGAAARAEQGCRQDLLRTCKEHTARPPHQPGICVGNPAG